MRGWWDLPESEGGGRVRQVQWRRGAGLGTLIETLPVERVQLA